MALPAAPQAAPKAPPAASAAPCEACCWPPVGASTLRLLQTCCRLLLLLLLANTPARAAAQVTSCTTAQNMQVTSALLSSAAPAECLALTHATRAPSAKEQCDCYAALPAKVFPDCYIKRTTASDGGALKTWSSVRAACVASAGGGGSASGGSGSGGSHLHGSGVTTVSTYSIKNGVCGQSQIKRKLLKFAIAFQKKRCVCCCSGA